MNITNYSLQIFLPALMLIAIFLILLWKFARNAVRINDAKPDIEKVTAYKRLQRVGIFFWIILGIFAFMVYVYTIAPEYYFIFLPIDELHHPLINQLGMLILEIALVWILIAQLQIDKELYKYSRDIESLSAMELVRYSEKMLLSGMMVLFIGFFTTITNVVGFFLVVSGLYYYFRILK